MVDVFGATASNGAIQLPILIDIKQVVQVARGAALGLAPRDPLTGVLNDLDAGWNVLQGEYTPAVNPRRANDEPEARITRIDGGYIGAGRSSDFEIGLDEAGPLPDF